MSFIDKATEELARLGMLCQDTEKGLLAEALILQNQSSTTYAATLEGLLDRLSAGHPVQWRGKWIRPEGCHDAATQAFPAVAHTDTRQVDMPVLPLQPEELQKERQGQGRARGEDSHRPRRASVKRRKS